MAARLQSPTSATRRRFSMKNWVHGCALAVALVASGCAPVDDGDLSAEGPEGAEAIDEARTPSWERFVGAWEGREGRFVSIVFTRTAATGTAHRYFAYRQVECIRAPCLPVREEGTYRAST